MSIFKIFKLNVFLSKQYFSQISLGVVVALQGLLTMKSLLCRWIASKVMEMSKPSCSSVLLFLLFPPSHRGIGNIWTFSLFSGLNSISILIYSRVQEFTLECMADQVWIPANKKPRYSK